MPPVRIESGTLLVGDLRVPLFMGELHYWRLAPARWPEVLKSCRRLGLETLATYIPWQYHEIAPGRFDFDGSTEPQRSLIAFLDLVAIEGFSLFIRPGPYIYSEWTNAGVPDRVVTLPRCSEEYRREARVWMRAVTDAIRPWFATSHAKYDSGGPIVLFQADNETDNFTHWFERECGLDGPSRDGALRTPQAPAEPSVFHDFLAARYSSVAALNHAWGTAYTQIADAQPAAHVTDRHSPGALTRTRDYWRFQHWLTARTLRWHVDEYRALGVDLPIVANYYPGGDVQNWRVLSDDGGADILAIDWYPRNEFAGPPAAPGSEGQATGGGGIFGLSPRREHRCFLDSCRYQSAVSRLPMIGELECGVWHGYHTYTGAFTQEHYRLLACSALLAGIKAWNWYMLVGRDNWYFTPINERGEIRPEAAVFMDIHRVVRELDPASLIRIPACRAFFHAEQIGTDDLLATNPVLQSLYDAGIDTELVDAATLATSPSAPAEGVAKSARPGEAGGDESARPLAPTQLLFYASADWLPRTVQEQLAANLESGGTLILFQTFPRADETFRPCNILNIPAPDRVLSRLGKKLSVALGTSSPIAEGPVWVWDSPPGEPITGTQTSGTQQAIENADKWAAAYVGKKWTVGYREKRGRGTLIVIGLTPNADLARAAMQWAGSPAPVRAAVPGVQTALFHRRGNASELYIIAANMSGAAAHAPITLTTPAAPARVRTTDLFSGAARTSDRSDILLPLDRASGSVFRVEPA